MSEEYPVGVSMIAGGIVSVGAGAAMASVGGKSNPRVLVLYRPGDEPPGWDPDPGIKSPALFATGLILLGLGTLSTITGGVLMMDEAPNPEPQDPKIEAALRTTPVPVRATGGLLADLSYSE